MKNYYFQCEILEIYIALPPSYPIQIFFNIIFHRNPFQHNFILHSNTKNDKNLGLLRRCLMLSKHYFISFPFALYVDIGQKKYFHRIYLFDTALCMNELQKNKKLQSLQSNYQLFLI